MPRNNRLLGILALAAVIVAAVLVVAYIGGFFSIFGQYHAISVFAPQNLTAGRSASFALFLQSSTPNMNYVTSVYPYYEKSSTSEARYFTVYVNGVLIANITNTTRLSTDINALSAVTGLPIGNSPQHLEPYPSNPYCISYCYYPVSGSWSPTPAGWGAWYIFNYTPSDAPSYNVVVNITYTWNNNPGSSLVTQTALSFTVPAAPVISESPPVPPEQPGLLEAIKNAFEGFKAWLLSVWDNYFNVNVQLLSLASSSLPNNETALGNYVNVTVSLTIPSNLESNAWNSGVTRLTRTYCQIAAVNLNIYIPKTTVLYQSALVNMTSTSFTQDVSLKPSSPGLIVVGGQCDYTNNTFSLGTGQWSGWTPYALVPGTNVSKAIYVVGPVAISTGASPQGAGSVSPSSGTYSFGTQLTLSQSAAPGYVFVGWTGSGSGNYTGNETSPTITLNSQVTEIANYKVSSPNPPPPPTPNLLSAIENFFSSIGTWFANLFGI